MRLTINDIFSEVYNQIDKTKMKEIILNKQKIKYSMDKLSNKVDELKLKIPENENRLNEVFKNDNERSLELFDQLFNSSNLYDLFMKESKAIKQLESADKEIQESFKRVEEYISENGNELEKEALHIFKTFREEKEDESIKDTTKNVEVLKTRLEKLVESYNKNESFLGTNLY